MPEQVHGQFRASRLRTTRVFTSVKEVEAEEAPVAIEEVHDPIVVEKILVTNEQVVVADGEVYFAAEQKLVADEEVPVAHL